MIKINDKRKCCGCSGCAEICPKRCISLEEDMEGFRYPKVDLSLCIECGACERVCPVINDSEIQHIQTVYAASNRDNTVRKASSSGGVFSYLANQIIDIGGVVYGAAYNEQWEVMHVGIESKENLYKLRSSKYVQSVIGDTYKDVRNHLQQGRKVLFSGTPCQVAGLRTFLRKDYSNLYCVDFICHGVPSPKVWRKYLAELIKTRQIGEHPMEIKHVDFRSKVPNWLFSQIFISSEHGIYKCPKDKDPYFNSFVMNVTIRPICFTCPFKSGKSGSDLTIADFWGINVLDPDIYSDDGVSMVIDYGKNKFDLSGLNTKQEDNGCIASCNGSFYHSAQFNGNRKVFFGKIDSTNSITGLMRRCTSPTFTQRIGNLLYRKLVR